MAVNILIKSAFAAVLGFGMVAGAQAALVSVALPESGNDCSGLFGKAPDCNVLGPAPTNTEFSPLVVKYDMGNDGTTVTVTTINSDRFPSFVGSEIVLDFSDPTNGSGTWTYTQGAGDPSIKYWTAKAGNGFNLFWIVDDAELLAGGACAGGLIYTDLCLAKALIQTSGIFSTPENKNLSHIGLYDTAGGTVPDPVPLPAAAWLLISGLGGLGLLSRRRKAA